MTQQIFIAHNIGSTVTYVTNTGMLIGSGIVQRIVLGYPANGIIVRSKTPNEMRPTSTELIYEVAFDFDSDSNNISKCGYKSLMAFDPKDMFTEERAHQIKELLEGEMCMSAPEMEVKPVLWRDGNGGETKVIGFKVVLHWGYDDGFSGDSEIFTEQDYIDERDEFHQDPDFKG